jgi:hypothetical protein
VKETVASLEVSLRHGMALNDAHMHQPKVAAACCVLLFRADVTPESPALQREIEMARNSGTFLAL